MSEKVNHPPHYTQGKVECIDAIESACAGLDGFEGYCTGNALKYLYRWKHKNGLEDLQKARWYINKLAKHLLEQNDGNADDQGGVSVLGDSSS